MWIHYVVLIYVFYCNMIQWEQIVALSVGMGLILSLSLSLLLALSVNWKFNIIEGTLWISIRCLPSSLIIGGQSGMQVVLFSEYGRSQWLLRYVHFLILNSFFSLQIKISFFQSMHSIYFIWEFWHFAVMKLLGLMKVFIWYILRFHRTLTVSGCGGSVNSIVWVYWGHVF